MRAKSRMMGWLIVGLGVFVAAGTAVGQTEDLPEMGREAVPGNLTLPLKIEDMSLKRDFVPFGVLRLSKEGHEGLDIYSEANAPVYAVADGVILSIEANQDPFPGVRLTLLLTRGPERGSGWTFIYDRIEPHPGLQISSSVRKGVQLGTGFPSGWLGTHLELSYWSESDQRSDQRTCWVNQLEPDAREDFLSHFQEEAPHIAEFWRTKIAKGKYVFSGLLDSQRFPEGLQPCYPLGTASLGSQ